LEGSDRVRRAVSLIHRIGFFLIFYRQRSLATNDTNNVQKIAEAYEIVRTTKASAASLAFFILGEDFP